MRVLRIGTLGAVGLAACAAAVAVGQSGGPDKAADIKASIDISKPKNIILFIGDGMGEQEVTSGRYYGKGATGRLNMDALKLRGDVTTYNVGPAAQAPYPPNYVPDSAPTASAWSSGIKTLDGRLGQGPSAGVTVPGTNFKTYMEIARDRGLATGNVSTAEITDATPAGPSSHISQRGCQGPNDTRAACPTETKAAGGLGSIAEQQADNQFDVVLGGDGARRPALLAGEDRVVVDPSGGLQLAPERLREREVRDAIAVQVAELVSAEPERVLATGAVAGFDAGPRRDLVGDLDAGRAVGHDDLLRTFTAPYNFKRT